MTILLRPAHRYNVVILRTTYPHGILPAIAAGALVVVGLATAATPVLHASDRYVVAATGVFLAIMAIAARHVRAHHPFAHFGPANHVTTGRAALVALVAPLVGEPASAAIAAAAVGVAVICVLLDGLDGRLARQSRLASAFGGRFDMEIDAFLILLLSLLVWQHGKAGAWVLGCGLMRYAFVAAGSVVGWVAQPLRPTLRGRTVAVLQVVGLALALLPAVRVPASTAIAAATLAALVWSFAVDVAWLARQSRS